MSLSAHAVWWWIGLACLVAFMTKWLGFAMPARWLSHPRMAAVAASMTVALLSALTVMNTWAAGTALVLDARMAALMAAALALWLRWPFLVVVLCGAVTAAFGRWFFAWS